MSARAAARLETLGFRHVYRYQPGKADWFAAGLPREGMEAGTARVADVAERDVPTCTVDERVGEVRDRLRRTGSDVCVVVDGQRIVLGLVEGVSADTPPDTRVESVMRSNPITFRPNVPAGRLPDYLKAPATRLALVTTSDGVLLGLLRR
jgi:CBS domain-containing protein